MIDKKILNSSPFYQSPLCRLIKMGHYAYDFGEDQHSGHLKQNQNVLFRRYK